MRNALLLMVAGVLVWSGLAPKDRFTWFLEVAPVLIGLPVALLIDKRHGLSTLLFALMCFHAVILCVGGKYTYAEVPIGFYFQELFHTARNHYDRVGHFAQGFVPAIILREWLIRKKAIAKKSFLPVIVVSMCLAFSACYEFIEWFTALATGEGADAFLGTQGDIWDTQWDMFMALIGSSTALLTLSRIHDRQLATLK